MTPGTCSMVGYLKNSQYYSLKNRADTPVSEIEPGDIILFSHSSGSDVASGSCNVAHVGIVNSVGRDGITTIESNSYDVSRFLPTENCGRAYCPVSESGGLNVAGFALNRGI